MEMRSAFGLAILFSFLFGSPAWAIACHGGETDEFVKVEMLNTDTGVCIETCLTRDRFDHPDGWETITRYIFAVSDGVSFEKIQDASKGPFGTRGDIKIYNVKVLSVNCHYAGGSWGWECKKSLC